MLNLLQKAGILGTLVLLLTYAGLFIWGIQETRDAKTVETVQVKLQTAVSKGMAALELPPSQIHPQNIINAAQSGFPKGVKVDPQYHMVLNPSGREAQYQITDSGDLILVSVTNFSRFHVENGRIMRNNHWLLP